MTVAPAAHYTSVQRASQLEVGAYYQIKGTDSSGYPIPKQVFRLESKVMPPTGNGMGIIRGTLWWEVMGFRGIDSNFGMYLADVNIPNHYQHDHHLERIDQRLIDGALHNPGYKDIVVDRQMTKPKRRLTWDLVLKDIGQG